MPINNPTKAVDGRVSCGRAKASPSIIIQKVEFGRSKKKLETTCMRGIIDDGIRYNTQTRAEPPETHMGLLPNISLLRKEMGDVPYSLLLWLFHFFFFCY